MRPRSQLVSKRRLLLPTIREGTEELVKDLNEANALRLTAHARAVTSEDYLLSICHLAHPTFPTREAPPPVSGHRDTRLRPQAEGEPGGIPAPGGPDPLEYIYGHRDALSGGSHAEGRFGMLREGRPRSRAHSIPRASSPDLPLRRKSSAPETRSPTHGVALAEVRRGGDGASANKQSLISQWISECRSAWREARSRACMLPAIAEV